MGLMWMDGELLFAAARHELDVIQPSPYHLHSTDPHINSHFDCQEQSERPSCSDSLSSIPQEAAATEPDIPN